MDAGLPATFLVFLLAVILSTLVGQILLCRKNKQKYSLIIPGIVLVFSIAFAIYFAAISLVSLAVVSLVVCFIYIAILLGIRFLYS